jgi:hypothetical protein
MRSATGTTDMFAAGFQDRCRSVLGTDANAGASG